MFEKKWEQGEAELRRHLEEQIVFLEASCAAYDGGYEAEAKRLAVTLRILAHDTGSQKSLLGQLGMLDMQFHNICYGYPGKSQMGWSALTENAVFPTPKPVPLLDNLQDSEVGFNEWWTGTVVYCTQDGQKVSRKDLVTSVADQDGGAHVDPSLNALYAQISRLNDLGWNAIVNGVNVGPIGAPVLASVRHIAHEMLKTLKPGYTKVRVDQGAVFGGFFIGKLDAPV